jgi:PAS domain S-box-containing protein
MSALESAPDTIRVMHVDDEPELTDLTATYLERESDRFEVATETAAEDGLDTLADRSPDCIVSDYDMPGMDGIEFLERVRETHPDIPFLLFTGRGSEQVASDAIAAGVTDYLQKGVGAEQYELLANRITNAVEAAEARRRAERREELMRLTELAGDTGGFELDPDSGTVLLTDGATRVLGLSDEVALTLENWLERFHPEDRVDLNRALDRARDTGEEAEYTPRYRRPDGSHGLLDVTVTPVTTDGTATIVRGSIHEITDRRNRQRTLKQHETVIEALSDAVYVLDKEGRFTYVNDEFLELVEYERERILGSDPSLIKDREAVERAERKLGRLLSSDGPETLRFDVTIQPRDGEPITCEDHMGVLPYEGDSFEGSVGTLRAVTDDETGCG